IRALRDPNNPAQPIGPVWMAEVGRDLTALGGVAVLVLVTAIVGAFFGLTRRYPEMYFVFIAAIGGLLISVALKALVSRPRPDIVPHLSHVYTSSFPSGHSMMSATVYLTLGMLLARFVKQRRLKFYFLIVAVLLTCLVGTSRVYMGVHYPTDVLAGCLAGLVWALLCWLTAGYLIPSHRLKQDRAESSSPRVEREVPQ
ncbi:MAG: phosphatase PAP2 family protein, partial [Planctomycetota bacterium]